MAQEASQVRQAIEQDRLELADTVQALARKADVKQRVRETVSKNADDLQHKASEIASRVKDVTPEQVQSGLGTASQSVRRRPFPYAVVAAFCLGVLVGRRRRRTK